VRALLAQPREKDELFYHTFVFPEHKVLYHETPKVACSAIKVGLLPLTGRKLADLGMSQYPRKFPEAVVHDRMKYPAPSLVDVDDATLADAVGGKGWLRFCVARDPFSRLYAAWEDKIFLGDPTLLDRFQPGGRDREVAGAIDLRATFSAFVEELAEDRQAYFEDFHFRPQWRVIHLDSVPFTDIVRLGDLDRFWAQLQQHVRTVEASIELRLPWINEGLGLPWQNSYTSDAVSLVADIYADDMRRLGFDAPVVDGLEPIRLDPVARALLDAERNLVYQLKSSFDR
jgi:hypothetical protein